MDPLLILFKALADPTRIRIMNLLLDGGERCVCEFVALLSLPQSLVSRHLTVLKTAGLVRARREGQWMYYTLITGTPDLDALHAFLSSIFTRAGELKADRRMALKAGRATCGPTPRAPQERP